MRSVAHSARWRPYCMGGALVVLTVVLYGSVLGHRFTGDAIPRLRDDPRVTELRLGEIFGRDYWDLRPNEARGDARPGLYRPVTLTWLGVSAALTPKDSWERGVPLGANAGNILLRILSVVLVWRLLARLLGPGTRAEVFSAVGAVAFVVHPVSVETVATQMGAAEGLVAVLGTGSLLAALSAMTTGRTRYWILHVVLLALALLAKESAVALVPGVFCLAGLIGGWSWRRSIVATVPALVVAGAWIGLRAMVLGGALSVPDAPLVDFPVGPRVATALAAMGSYDLAALGWPRHLLPHVTLQDVAPASGLWDARVGLGILLLALLLLGLLWGVRRHRAAGWGFAFALVSLVPVSNLLVLIGAVAGTRFLHLPWIGLIIGCAALGEASCRRLGAGMGRTLGIAFAALLVFWSVLTLEEVATWRDPVTLFESARGRSPGSAWIHQALGTAMAQRAHAPGRAPDLGDLGAAIQEFRAGLGTRVPEIPGTEGRVPENILELHYKCAMDGGTASLIQAQVWAQRAYQGEPDAKVALESMEHARSACRDAIGFLESAVLVAGRGLRQERDRATDTRWEPLLRSAHEGRAHGILRTVLMSAKEDRSRLEGEFARALEDGVAAGLSETWSELMRLRLARTSGDETSYRKGLRHLMEKEIERTGSGGGPPLRELWEEGLRAEDAETKDLARRLRAMPRPAGR